MEKEPISLKFLTTDINGMKVEKMELNKLSLMTGMNGTGKSMILVLIWIMNFLSTVFFKMGKNKAEVVKVMQLLIDKSFEKNDFTGKVAGDFIDFDLEITLEDGKIVDLYYCQKVPTEPNPEEFSIPVFMSTNTRLFTDIKKYIKTKKLLGITESFANIKDINELEKLAELYRIYDIMFIERMLNRLKDPFFKVSDQVKKDLKELMKIDLTSIFYNEDTDDIFITENKDGKLVTRSATTLSNGEQAWINMSIQN